METAGFYPYCSAYLAVSQGFPGSGREGDGEMEEEWQFFRETKNLR